MSCQMEIMEKDKVQQDDANLLNGLFKEVKYATEKDGTYTTVKTVGWEAENIVSQQVWEDIHEHVEEVRQQVIAGKKSPIAFHMTRQMLEPDMLSGYTGFPTFIVRLHLRPWFFNRLGQRSLEKYARAFRISVDDLKVV